MFNHMYDYDHEAAAHDAEMMYAEQYAEYQAELEATIDWHNHLQHVPSLTENRIKQKYFL